MQGCLQTTSSCNLQFLYPLRVVIADPDKLKDVLLSNSGLSRKLQTVMGDYVEMEGYFMKEMLLKVAGAFQNNH